MRYKIHVFFFLICLAGNFGPIIAQSTVVVSGSVRDKQTGESLIKAVVRIQELPNAGIISNEYGFYSLTLPKGNYSVVVSQVGYETLVQKIKLDSSITINFSLQTKNVLKEVVVESSRKNDNLTKAQMGTETINMAAISKVPVIFGEKDLLKTIQLLPGVKSAGEGNSGFFVRGGGADQNLILLDEAPVYNATHLLGFFSTFNSDAIKDATIIKGNSASQYGGRLSSVLDVKMKEGNNQDYVVNGGIGLISSKVSVEGPLQKNKSSFILSGRRTYADMFLKLSKDENLKNTKLFFYDLNTKLNYKLSDKDRVYLSGYFGRDKFGFSDQFGFDWGNQNASP